MANERVGNYAKHFLRKLQPENVLDDQTKAKAEAQGKKLADAIAAGQDPTAALQQALSAMGINALVMPQSGGSKAPISSSSSSSSPSPSAPKASSKEGPYFSLKDLMDLEEQRIREEEERRRK